MISNYWAADDSLQVSFLSCESVHCVQVICLSCEFVQVIFLSCDSVQIIFLSCDSVQVIFLSCDSGQRAPDGCLQYYTGPGGVLESFNYNSRYVCEEGCTKLYIVQWYLSYFYNYEHKIIRKPIFIKKISVAAANLVKDAIDYFKQKTPF